MQDQEYRTPDGHLWGFLTPQNLDLCRIDFQKLKSKYSIGRRQDARNDIILPWPKISNFHYVVEWDTGETSKSAVKVTDFSSNGTFINGVKIGKGNTMLLHDGDVIAFGTCAPQLTTKGPGDYVFVYRHVNATHPVQGLLAVYDLHHCVGQGGFATVVKALHKAERRWYAVKRIPARCLWRRWGSASCNGSLSDASYDFTREIVVSERLQHKNICQLKEVFYDEFGLSIVLEWVPGGDLFDLLLKKNGLPEPETQHLTYQICDALAYVHRQGIIHRDLKPENILLTADDPPIVKVADFGLAGACASEAKLRTPCGTPIFAAPEVTKRKKGIAGYDQLVDSWSVGVMVFSMLTNVMPFPENEDGSPVSHRQIKWSLLREFHVSDSGQDFIHRLLEYEPCRRMSSSGACKHSWLAKERHDHSCGDRLLSPSIEKVPFPAGGTEL